jgi:hypothetical protein
LGLGDQDVGADDADGDPNAQGEGEHDDCAVHRGSLATGSFSVIGAAEIYIVSLEASLVHCGGTAAVVLHSLDTRLRMG